MNVWIVTVVLIAAGQAQDARPPLAAMNRLALAAATRAEGDSPEVSARRARLESLAAFTRSFTARTERGQASDLFNYMQVVRDTVDAGAGLALIPEEALGWQRVGLDLAESQHRMIERRVRAGDLPDWALDQSRAQVQFLRSQYRQALLRCRTP